MSIETMTKLATVTVGSGGAASIDFTNIPATYTDLLLKCSTRQNGTANGYRLHLRFNNSSASEYSSREFYYDNATAGNGSGSSESYIRAAFVQNGAFTANAFNNVEIYIPNYLSSNYKSTSSDGVDETNAQANYLSINSGLWSNTAAINRITLSEYGGSGTIFAQHSTATLYGVKAARTAVGNSIKATGGNISFDGTYVVHTFTSSGTFRPTTPINVDYLVIAGGGGGGGTNAGSVAPGGGGAGGFRSSVSPSGGGNTSATGESVLFLTSNDYAVTVGAGGAGATTVGSGAAGSNSILSSITSIGGGGGGGGGGTRGGDGGSGGGGGNAGTGTSNQGYDGGVGSNNGGAGGGGASALGGNSTSNNGGAGGAGLTNSISSTSITYAGGGGGGSFNATGGSAGSGGGGAGGNGGVNGSSATSNTGSGGGGSGNKTTGVGGNGGSGIVIIRYKG